MLEPLTSADGIDLSAPHVIAIVAFATVVVLVAIVFRRFLLAAVDELGPMSRAVTAWLALAVLRRRPMPHEPWFCAACRSRNGVAASRCYSCGAARATAQAPVPDAEPPAGAGAGRSRRTRA